MLFCSSHDSASDDIESRKEQKGIHYFAVQPMMAELWLNLFGDVGKKEQGLFIF